MKRKKVLFACLLIAFISFVIALYFYFNSTALQSGILYYCSDGTAYSYNVKTRMSKRVSVNGYDNVEWYYPEEKGYIACVNNDEEGSNTAIIKDGDVIYNTDSPLSHFAKKGDFVFFTADDYYLNAVNIKTKKSYSVSGSVYYGYSFAGNYLYFSERNPESPDTPAEIKVVDCSDISLNSKVIDKGFIIKTAEDRLYYKKESSVYSYDFISGKSALSKSVDEAEDSYEYRYLGALNTDKSDFTIHLKQKVIFDKNANYYDYETGLMRGVYLPTKEHLQVLPKLEIKDNKGRLYIFVKRLDYSVERYSVTAYVNNGKIYYVNPTCLNWIY